MKNRRFVLGSLLAMTLLDMELQGFIRSLPGKMYQVN